MEILPIDPLQSAIAAGLRYVRDRGPCIQRRRCGRSFTYIGADGRTVRDKQVIQRIRSLAIPPAWERVWICPNAMGHIQAVGWDAKGRKQYRYHPLYSRIRNEAKFGRMIAFGTVLSLIRRRVEKDLKRPGLPREKVLATVVRLLETTAIRVGNEEYARSNDSFGLTTLRNRHVQIAGATLRFRFRGKSGLAHEIELTDRRLARVVQQCQDLPGYELFQYVDGSGEICRVDSADVNGYLRRITGQDFSAKDFRTWTGTVLAARELTAEGPCRNERDGKRKIVASVRRVAQRLGNRPATCRKYYIHPAVIEAYSSGSLFPAMQQGSEEEAAYDGQGLARDEYCVMVLIAQYMENLASQAHKSVRPRAASCCRYQSDFSLAGSPPRGSPRYRLRVSVS
jgi:DNA topoisomerase-1